MGWLDGQVVLITGGGRGIGLAVAVRFMGEGARVAVLDRDISGIERLTAERGLEALLISGDASSIPDTEAALAAVLGTYGRLDTFVGNAGIFDFFTPFEEVDCGTLATGFDEIFAANVKACLIGARIAAAALRSSHGCMIFTVSNSGLYAGGGGVL